MIVTKDWIEQFQTPGGGWTKKQLEAIGVKWPPAKGWKDRVNGSFISDKDAVLFEELHKHQQIKLGKTQEGLFP